MSQKPKILVLPKWYPNKFDPFDGNFIENHVRAIEQYCSQVVLFVHSDETLKDETYKVVERREDNIPVIRVYFKKANNRLLTGIRYIKSQLEGYRIIRQKYGPPDLCHVHVLTRSSFLALWLKWRRNIPYIISEHWSGYFPQSAQYRGFLKKILTKYVVKKAALVTTVSEYLKEAMLKHGLENNYIIIPNVVDTSVFQPDFTKVSGKVKRIIHVSTLDIVPKNVPGILDVIKKLSERRKDFELHILGDGKDKNKVVAMAKELGLLNSKVFFYGNLPRQEVAAHLAKSDFLVLFSHYENQPCVMIEAFSAGIPVVAPKVGGIPEHLNKERGHMITVGNEAEFETAIDQMLDRCGEFDRQKLHNYAERHFSQNEVGKNFFDAYQKILNR